MKIIGTLTIKNNLANSHYGFKPTKPLDQYKYKILEKNSHGCLCVVQDGDDLGLLAPSPLLLPGGRPG